MSDYPNTLLRKGVKLKKFDSKKELSDFTCVATAFFQALQDDDVASALEILEGYLMTVKKSDISKKSKIPSSTM